MEQLYRPMSMLWNGQTSWVLLDGHDDDVSEQARVVGLRAEAGPPELPPFRWSVPPSEIASLAAREAGPFVAEMGVGVVHADRPPTRSMPDPAVVALHERIKSEFDPGGRLNPGVDVFAPA